MARGRAWGNALGGWKKQARAANGRFGNGSGKKARSAAKSTKAKRRNAKARPTRTNMERNRKRRAVAGNVIIGAAFIGAAYLENRAANSGINKGIGGYTIPRTGHIGQGVIAYQPRGRSTGIGNPSPSPRFGGSGRKPGMNR